MDDLRVKSLKEWQDARFGMFIHWGAYSVGGLDCMKMQDMGIPVQEYVDRFAREISQRYVLCHENQDSREERKENQD